MNGLAGGDGRDEVWRKMDKEDVDADGRRRCGPGMSCNPT